MNTIGLNDPAWDLFLDVNGNIALQTGDDAIAQDAASAIRTFEGEVFFDTTLGIPYWARVLGKLPPLSYLKSEFSQAALTVPGTSKAVTYFSSFSNRSLTGQVQITLDNGTTVAVNF